MSSSGSSRGSIFLKLYLIYSLNIFPHICLIRLTYINSEGKLFLINNLISGLTS